MGLSVAEASIRLGVSIPVLYRRMHAGDLKYCKVGARRVILESDLLDFIYRNRHVGPTPSTSNPVRRPRETR